MSGGGVLDPKSDRGVPPGKLERTHSYREFSSKIPIFTGIFRHFEPKPTFIDDFCKIRLTFRDFLPENTPIRAAHPCQLL